MKTKAYLVLLFFCLADKMGAQDRVAWHGKKCAVCLTYDDSLNVDLDNVVPALDSLGLKASFYVTGFSPSMMERSSDWKGVAANGHELGNHTLFHPCDSKPPGREWVKPDYDLSTYSVQRFVDEVKAADILLNALDGKTKRTFAYPCGDAKAGGSSYVDKLKSEFVAARGVFGKMQRIDQIDLFDVGSYVINGQSGDELIDLVKKAEDSSALLVFLFHGVGGEHALNVSLEAHNKLLHFLKENERDLWIAPLVEIAGHIVEYREGKTDK